MRRLCNLAMILSTITVPVIAHAFENAAATFTITPTEVSGIGPSETVEFTVSGAALSNVKRVFISISAAENSFDIANTALSTGADFSGFLNLGTQFDGTNAFTLSLASFGAGFTGDGVIGTITIPTTAAYSTSMTETIIITEIRVGPSSSEEDVFAEQDLGLAVDVNAGAPAPPMMTIMELTDADLATLSLTDGSIADWEALGPADLTEADFVALSVGDGAPIAAADLSYRIWTRWHASTDLLYVAMERVDDVHVGGGSGNLWHYDGIELMVDGDHSGGDYSNSANTSWDSDEQWLNTHRTAQQYIGAPDVSGTDHVVSGAGIDVVSDPPYADGGGSTDGATPATSVVEFYVTPFDNLLHDNMSA
ncbi:MAG: hypothetical protein HOH74_06935, partial [Gemmatimonadetes bacterium]|nr:hypothetical protein [Gemmatimonadota bacterium]